MPSQQRLYRWSYGTAGLLFALALAIPIGSLLGFRFIITSSVPAGLWWDHSREPTRGAYVLICLPSAIAREGRRAGYLLPGTCPGNVLPVMKRVIALAGDVVTVSAAGISVNGRGLPNSMRLTRDSHAQPIVTAVSDTTYRIAPNVIWVLGDWFKSWDSRYYGGVSVSGLIGIGTPLVVRPAGS